MTASTSSGPVLVIGLDMGDGPLIRHWASQGHLPHLARAIASGAWFDLDSPAAVLHTSTWPTFATGTLPGRHGVYYPYQPTPGRQLARHIAPDQYGEPTFWRLAADDGRRCLVYDIPETFPEAGFAGRAIFDWGTWAWYGEPSTQPADLMKRLRRRFGAYPLGYEAKKLALNYPDHIEQRLTRSVVYKATTTGWLLEQEGWDLAVVGFCETHPAGHYLWPAGAASAQAADDPAFGPLLNVYRAVDEAVGALAARLPRHGTLIIASGDGVRPNRCAWHLLPSVLERLGYVASKRHAPADAPAVASAAAPVPAPQRLLANVKRRVASALPWRVRDRLGVWIQTSKIDWSRTRAFTLPTDLEGCIRVNLKGREPHGIVGPGAEYDALCDEIQARLLELVNPTTGRSAIRRIWRRDEVFPGPRREELPDIVVTWNDEASLTALQSPRIGVVAGVNPDPRTGTHSEHGFLIVAGPGVAAGSIGRGRLTDIAPTVLHLLGPTQASGFDGNLLQPSSWTGDAADRPPGAARIDSSTESTESLGSGGR